MNEVEWDEEEWGDWDALDPCKGISLALTVGLIFWAFVVIACLAMR